jgi:Dehydrogenases with different specificities (related to short-chain alcohol dehydrogenases)
MNDAKIALVTGGNKGIGYEIARQLGTTGATVLLGARDAGRGEAAAAALRAEGLTVRPVRLDVTDEATIEAAATWIEREYGRLDVLVNNAGTVQEWGMDPTKLPIPLLRSTYETNVFGVVAVTNAMLPLLRRAPAARIVNMSSSLGSLARSSDPNSDQHGVPLLAYNSSKAAVNRITVQYAAALRDTPIKVNAACPGFCATDMNGHRGHRTPAQGAAIAVRLATLPPDGPTGGFFEDDGPVPW